MNITISKKLKILKLVKKISGESYNQGTLANIAYKYPSDFDKQSKDIAKLFGKIEALLEEDE